jgi:hypothetical protein
MVAPIKHFTVLFKHVETMMLDAENYVKCLNLFKSVETLALETVIYKW